MLGTAPALFADPDVNFTYATSGTTASIIDYSGSGGYLSAMNWTDPWYYKTASALDPGDRQVVDMLITGPTFLNSGTADTYICVARYSDNSTATVITMISTRLR